jgi:hypothetical protein
MSPTSRLTILILADAGDQHSNCVQFALETRGHRVVRYSGDDLPERASVDFEYRAGADRLRVRSATTEFDLDAIDVVWNRRPTWATMPACVDPLDVPFVRQQNHMLGHAVHRLLERAFWANDWNAARACDLKPWQLRLAAGAGLRLPETLISNDPDAIRRFIARHDGVIHKPLAGAGWREDGRTYGSYTARVTREDLPPDALLRAVAPILQRKLEKQYEVRAQFFGATCMAVRIESSQLTYGEYDWRLNQTAEAASGAIELPAPVYAACRRLMQRLGIVAGGFDFIVTPEDEWYFLEVNEAGQFLFLEQWASELRLVDACAGFLAARDPGFVHRSDASSLGLAEICQLVPAPDLVAPAPALECAMV